MSELVELPTDGTEGLGVDSLTTAPGALPLAEIIARIVAQRKQFRHDNMLVPPAPIPGQAIEIWATSGEDLPIEQAVLFYTTDGSLPVTSSPGLPMQRVGLDWDVQAGYLTRWRALLAAQSAPTMVRYRIAGWHSGTCNLTTCPPDVWAQDGLGFHFHFSAEQATTTFSFMIEKSAPVVPVWVQHAVIYHIFLDRFRSSESSGGFPSSLDPAAMHGGSLRGVTAALPYLAELGINCLWLSPINPAETYHRYDATDFYEVDAQLGTKEDLKELTEQAHALDMHVLLDFVPSHVSWHHPAFLAAQRDQQAATFDWFTFEEWPERYRSFLDCVPSLPSLRTESKGVREHLIGSALQWMSDYGIDGFRLDHAIGPDMDFWTAFRQATRDVAPDVFLVGEVTDTPDALLRYRGKLDGVLDFPLASALRHTFGLGNWSVRQLDNFLRAYEHYMLPGPGRVSFLDNHDMDRFLFVANDDVERLKLAALCQFTLSAVPVIYYGTEIGMSQRYDIGQGQWGGDAEARRPMSWQPETWNHELLSFYQALTLLRHSNAVLSQGLRQTFHLHEQTYAYRRTPILTAEPASGDVLVLFNLSNTSQMIPLPESIFPERYHCLLSTKSSPVISKNVCTVDLLLPPTSGAVLLIN